VCKSAYYCSVDCQRAHRKRAEEGHKAAFPELARLNHLVNHAAATGSKSADTSG